MHFYKNGIPELRNNGITKGKAMREGYSRTPVRITGLFHKKFK